MKKHGAFWIIGFAFFLSRGEAAETPIILGHITTPEISGAALLPGGRLILIADDPDDAVFEIENATAQSTWTKSLTPVDLHLDSSSPLADLEDTAWDPDGHLYLITSHSLSKKGKDKPERCHLGRVKVESTGNLE